MSLCHPVLFHGVLWHFVPDYASCLCPVQNIFSYIHKFGLTFCHISALAVFSRNALYKLTFFLLPVFVNSPSNYQKFHSTPTL